MRTTARAVLASGALLAACIAAPSASQSTPPRDDALRVDEGRVRRALRSPEAFYAFVTAPETRWADRAAAVRRAIPVDGEHSVFLDSALFPDADSAAAPRRRFILPAAYLPRVNAERAELEREQRVHAFGVQRRHPPGARYAQMLLPWRFVGERRRTILGHRWTVPERAVAQPFTAAEMAGAPWPWQVAEVLHALHRALMYGTPTAELYPALVALPCRTPEEGSRFIIETYTYAERVRGVTPEMAGAWRNLNLAARAERGLDAFRAIALARNEDAFWMGQVLMADLAPRAGEGDLATLAFHLTSLLDSPPAVSREYAARRPALPYAAFWTLGQRIAAMDPAAHWTERGYAAEYFLRAAAPAALAAVPRTMPSDSTEFEATVAAFHRWFAAHREELAAKAAAQAPILEQHRARLARVTLCAGVRDAPSPTRPR